MISLEPIQQKELHTPRKPPKSKDWMTRCSFAQQKGEAMDGLSNSLEFLTCVLHTDKICLFFQQTLNVDPASILIAASGQNCLGNAVDGTAVFLRLIVGTLKIDVHDV